MNTDGPELLTTAKACEELGFTSRSTLSRYVQLGRLKPAIKMPGPAGAFLFTRTEVERFKTERETAA